VFLINDGAINPISANKIIWKFPFDYMLWFNQERDGNTYCIAVHIYIYFHHAAIRTKQANNTIKKIIKLYEERFIQE
jgi:hypothetical protein